MNQRRKNHYIPKFLLDGFASRRRGRIASVWQIERGRAYELSTKDAAAARDFYGGSDSPVERDLAERETRWARVLDEIERTGDAQANAADLREFVWTLIVRTRAAREQFAETAAVGMAQLVAPSLDECWRRRLGFTLGKSPAEIVDAAWDQELDPTTKELLLELLQHPQIGPAVSAEMQRFLSGPFMEEIRNRFTGPAAATAILAAAARGQSLGLERILNSDEGIKPPRFDPRTWRIERRPHSDLILGDACLVTLDTDGRIWSWLEESNPDHLWHIAYLPLGPTTVLVAERDGTATFSLTSQALNIASAQLSRLFYLTPNSADAGSTYADLIGAASGAIDLSKIIRPISDAFLGRQDST